VKTILRIIIILISIFPLYACTASKTMTSTPPMPVITGTNPATATIIPSETPQPSLTFTPTSLPTATHQPAPRLEIPAATICRKMPSENGLYAHGISKGAQLELLGKDVTENWFLVVNPGSSGGKTCWIASRNVVIIGDLADVPYASAIQ